MLDIFSSYTDPGCSESSSTSLIFDKVSRTENIQGYVAVLKGSSCLQFEVDHTF